MAELPRIQVVAVHDLKEVPQDIRIEVVVANPSDEVLAELQYLLETNAVIQLGGVP